ACGLFIAGTDEARELGEATDGLGDLFGGGVELRVGLPPDTPPRKDGATSVSVVRGAPIVVDEPIGCEACPPEDTAAGAFGAGLGIGVGSWNLMIASSTWPRGRANCSRDAAMISFT